VRGTVIRVEVTRLPKPGGQASTTLWLWWSGPPGLTPGLDLCWRSYLHRFDIETSKPQCCYSCGALSLPSVSSLSASMLMLAA